MNMLQNISIGISGFSIAGCIFALLYSSARKRWETIGLFASWSALLAILSILSVVRRGSPNLTFTTEIGRWCDIVVLLLYGQLPFIFKSILKRPFGKMDYTIGILTVFSILAAFISSAGLRWKEIHSLEIVNLGLWGNVYVPHGTPSLLGHFVHSFILFILIYCSVITFNSKPEKRVKLFVFLTLPMVYIINLALSLGTILSWWKLPFLGEILATFIYSMLGVIIYIEEKNYHAEHEGLNTQVKKQSVDLKLSNHELQLTNQQLVQEINARARAEELALESESRFRGLFDNAIQLIGLLDTKGLLIEANRAALSMIDAEPHEVIGQYFWDGPWWSHDNNAQQFCKLAFEVALSGNVFRGETSHILKDGSIRYIDFSMKPVVDIQGKITLLIPEGRDITERKIAELALQESESRFRQIAENMQEVFFLFEKVGHKLLYLSPLIKDLFGIEAEQFIKDTSLFQRTIHPNDIRNVQFIHRGLFYSTPLDEEFRIIRPDGSIRWMRIRSFLVHDETGVVIRVAGLASDTTSIKLAEEQSRNQQLQLIQADKMVSLGLLVSGIGHEINNPTNFITLNTPLLRKAWENILPVLETYKNENGDFPVGGMNFSKLAPNILPLIDGIASGAKRIQRIVADLKDYARVDHDSSHKVVNVNIAVKSAVSLMEHRLRKSTRNFQINLSDTSCMVKGNLQRIEQVIINLLHNASDALRSDDELISIETKVLQNESKTLIIVKDGGEGIDPKNMQRITDPFFTTKRDRGGTGLGLSVSVGIIKEHNGKLYFESEPGKGTVVTLEFPLIQNISK